MSSTALSLTNWEDLIKDMETFIVEGKHKQCRELFRNIDSKKMPRQLKYRFADLMFRLNNYVDAIKILRDCIFQSNPFEEKATDREKILYASNLASLGATNDALKILRSVNAENEPECLFHIASANMFAWNYEAAVEALVQFNASENLSSYRRLVGRVNLVACLISLQKWEDAQLQVEHCISECHQNKYQLLHGNCFELQAQIHLFNGRFADALENLEKSRKLLLDQKGSYLLFVEKWSIFSKLKLNGFNSVQLVQSEFDTLRLKAIELGHWATLRECDLLQGVLLNDANLIRKIYVGTPSAYYRRRIQYLWGQKVSGTGKYELQLGSRPTSSGAVLHFDPLQVLANGKGLFEKPKLLQLFKALTDDFYQPATIGQLFQLTYPDELFNPESSIARVLQLMRNLNSWFAEQKLPLKVQFKKSEFKIISLEMIQIIIHRSLVYNNSSGNLNRLKDQFEFREFSAKQAHEFLNISNTTVEKLLKSACEKKLIQKRGSGRGTLYRLGRVRNKKSA